MARPKKYPVQLTEEQRSSLHELLTKGEAKARMLTRARILLLSAEGKTDDFIADALKVAHHMTRGVRWSVSTNGHANG